MGEDCTWHAARSEKAAALKLAFSIFRASICIALNSLQGTADEARWQAVPSSRQLIKQVSGWV